MWVIEAGLGTKKLHITAIDYLRHSDLGKIISKINMINW